MLRGSTRTRGSFLGKGKRKRGPAGKAKPVVKKERIGRDDPLAHRDRPENFCAKCQENSKLLFIKSSESHQN